MSDFTTEVTIDRPPADVFDAILDTRAWWNASIEGSTARTGDEFGFEVQGLHRVRVRVTEVVPHQRVEWLVLDNAFGFVTDQSEWIGNRMVFQLEPLGDGTALTFTQYGLTPAYECYDVCSNAWGFFISDSLRSLTESGEGKPEVATADTDEVPRDEFFSSGQGEHTA
jgi:uncharacterized protein YndB with AHSA1/START domain